VDFLNRHDRSALMARVKQKNTGPEILIRKSLHRLGYRYRLHSKTLPGRPDLVFPKRRKVIFVHGCFWHSHCKCKLATVPKTNTAYWVPKLAGNAKRDIQKTRQLRKQGWGVITVWQCQLNNIVKVITRLERFLR
jgi:DNA mismatch endonuclease (patch repair protein)